MTSNTPTLSEKAHEGCATPPAGSLTKQVLIQPQGPSNNLSAFQQLSFLDRFLAIWIFLAMAVGIIMGYFVPKMSRALLTAGEFGAVKVSVPIAVGLLVMMYPILCKVRYESLGSLIKVRALWIQVGFSLLVNWIFAPLTMVGLSWAFLPDKSDLREGLILVGIARCIAMVLIWNDLAAGDTDYCAMLVALNSVLQIILFAPLAVFYINVVSRSNIEIKYETVAISVAVFLGIPLAAAILTRYLILTLLFRGDVNKYNKYFIRWVAPFSLIGLLFTILVLFASQSRNIVGKITDVLRVSAPLIVYFVVIFGATLYACRYFGSGSFKGLGKWGYGITTTQSLTAASNNFELAIAVAVASYGPASHQALAATVGPLIEVPVLLGLVEVMKWTGKTWQWSDRRVVNPV
ncbi:arsenical-resistance protein ACR3 [Choiromyces venosus 120613-1]|uniref:Arsenical-resistance protein ACR3 n=1 Tax=Choiromyces venosus 120613-1 TaxID=1336337 RepID=A0A3N4K0Q0_9PEZI|nr:arsenical-resistance protein ACR3 [Choiromyces venosus 120613-1]